ncbi:unnamed protein product, partial [Adineta steineri]
VVYGTLVMMF